VWTRFKVFDSWRYYVLGRSKRLNLSVLSVFFFQILVSIHNYSKHKKEEYKGKEMVHHKPECKFPLRTSPVVHKIPKYPQNSCFVTTVSNCKIVGLHLSTFQHGLCQNQCIGIGNAVFKHQHNQFMQYFRTETVMQVLACRCCGESLHLHD
jgi:hypothetical protein